MLRKYLLVSLWAAGLCVLAGAPANSASPDNSYSASAELDAGNPSYPYRIVVLSDLHVSEANLEAGQKAVSDINSWDDVTLAAVIGDLCHRHGTTREFKRALTLLKGLTDGGKLVYAVTGNHDYIYKDRPEKEEAKIKGTAEERAAKLKRFREALVPRNLFGGAVPDRAYYSQKLGRYLVIFLSVNHLASNYLAEMSEGELKWLDEELSDKDNRDAPAIIFYHAPLAGTLGDDDRKNFFAQPQDRIQKIISRHKQVFLWVSGHTHTSPDSPYFTSRYKYLNRVTNIHNTDLANGPKVTNSLYLFKDRVVVKTFDHGTGLFWKKDRTFYPPK